MTRLLPSTNGLPKLLPISLGCAVLAGAGGALWIVDPAAEAVIRAPSAYREFKVRYDQVRCLENARGTGKVSDRWTSPYDPHLVTYDMPGAGCPGPLDRISLAEIADILSKGPPPSRREILLQHLRSRFAQIGAGWIIDDIRAYGDAHAGGSTPSPGSG